MVNKLPNEWYIALNNEVERMKKSGEWAKIDFLYKIASKDDDEKLLNWMIKNELILK